MAKATLAGCWTRRLSQRQVEAKWGGLVRAGHLGATLIEVGRHVCSIHTEHLENCRRQGILDGLRILTSALKHGVTPEAIRAALEVPVREVHQGSDLLLVIGADQAGRLLELVIADPEGDDQRVIHAMPLRAKFYRYL